MPLINMKLSKKESKEEAGISQPDTPRYPCGISLNLDEEVLDKLGIDKLPEVGEEKTLLAIVKVDGTHEHDSAAGKKRRSVSLQITDMALEEKVKKDVLKTLYGDDKK